MPATIEKPRSANVTIKLDASDRSRLKSLAATKKRTPHYLMREAIRAYIAKEEVEQRFIAVAEAAWDDYEKTGLHLSLEEVANWRENLKQNPDATLTPCHG